MKLMIAMLGFSVGVCAFAQNTYTYKDNNGQIFLTNVAQSGNITMPKANNNEGRIVIQSGERNISFNTPTSTTPLSDGELDNAIQRLTEKTLANNDYHDTGNVDYESYDKRQAFYYEWEYVEIENDFDNHILKVARLFSNDRNAILFIAYKNSDKKYQRPDIGLQLSGNLDNGVWHNFLCTHNCLNIDMNVDGIKYQNINMQYGSNQILVAKYPKTVLNYIKKGETIKIRLQSITGEPLVYIFEPNSPLDLQALKELE